MVKSWNKHGFGNIFQRKSRILARIAGTQRALALHPSCSLISLDKTLKMEFQTILRLEEEFWALKSRVGWVVEGDRNTSFFHTSTIVRRKFNKISRIQNSLEEWIEDRTQVMNPIQRGFLDLFSTSHVSSNCGFNPPSHVPSISSSEATCLVTPPSPDEIKANLWSLKPFKAPGPDGLHPGFFQRCWHIVRHSVIKEVSSIFSSGKVPEYLNKTLICLIPKCMGPETLGQFRPISLCNTVYKIVTKTLVARIRPLLSHLISPYQAAFIPGRHGIDNVIIAQELIHSMHKKKGKFGQIALKIDLEKAMIGLNEALSVRFPFSLIFPYPL